MKPRRTKEDLCLLCKSEKATKKNSHIISKFLGIKLLGGTGKRRGFNVKIKEGKFENQRIIQDSPKEDYILCPNCEKKLSVIENIVAKQFSLLRSDSERGKFFTEKRVGSIPYWEMTSLDPRIFHLFIYSLLWRLGISVTSFTEFKLQNNQEELLRKLLLEYLKDNHDDFIDYMEETKDKIFNFLRLIVRTPNKVNDHKLHAFFVIANTNKNYSASIGEFTFNLSFDKIFFKGKDLDLEDGSILLNNKGQNIKIQIVNFEIWEAMLKERRKNIEKSKK